MPRWVRVMCYMVLAFLAGAFVAMLTACGAPTAVLEPDLALCAKQDTTALTIDSLRTIEVVHRC